MRNKDKRPEQTGRQMRAPKYRTGRKKQKSSCRVDLGTMKAGKIKFGAIKYISTSKKGKQMGRVELVNHGLHRSEGGKSRHIRADYNRE